LDVAPTTLRNTTVGQESGSEFSLHVIVMHRVEITLRILALNNE